MLKALLYLLAYLATAWAVIALYYLFIWIFPDVWGVPYEQFLDDDLETNLLLFLHTAVFLLVLVSRKEVRNTLKSKTQNAKLVYPLVFVIMVCLYIFETIINGLLGIEGSEIEKLQLSYSSLLDLSFACVLAPVMEEMLFRGGIMYNLFLWKRSVPLALILSSLLFAVLHLTPEGIPFYIVFGLLAGWLVVRTGNLWPAIWLHFLNNAFVYVDNSAFGDVPPLYERVGIGLSLALAVVAMAVLVWCIILLNKKMKTCRYGVG